MRKLRAALRNESGAGAALPRPTYDAATKTASGKAPANATVTIAVNGTTVGTATTNAQGLWSYVFGTAPTQGQAITASANVTSPGLITPGAGGGALTPPAGFQFALLSNRVARVGGKLAIRKAA